MKIRDIVTLLDAKVFCCEDRLDTEVHAGCGCDMMSDVLAYVKDQAVLLTGLVNPQVVRTADMMDIGLIVFVRGKCPPEDVVEMARQRDMVVLVTACRMFSACGRLYAAGLGCR